MKAEKMVIAVLALLMIGGVLVIAFAQVNSSIANQSTASTTQVTRISPQDVRLANLASFEKQLRADVPIGMPKAAVEAYLKSEGFPFSYEGPSEVIGPNAFHIILNDIGTRNGYIADLKIQINLDETERVSAITFDVRYFGL